MRDSLSVLVTDRAGNVKPGAVVRVYHADAETGELLDLALAWKTIGGSQLQDNPRQADADGQAEFWLVRGVYAWTAESDGVVTEPEYFSSTPSGDGSIDPGWLSPEAAVIGPAGPQGPAGPDGPEGPRGADGANGAPGGAGADGPRGPQGAAGPTGPVGPEGPQGVKGDTGDTGPQGPQGDQGPQGTAGNSFIWRRDWEPGVVYVTNDAVDRNGSSYIAVAASTSVDPATDDGTHWDPLAIQGQVGPQGPTGSQGPAGPAGADGAQGAKGDAGAAGAQGPQGIQGPAGAAGAAGATGATGAQGIQGPAGAAGAQGPQGIQGPTGATGAQGAQGAQGPGNLLIARHFSVADPLANQAASYSGNAAAVGDRVFVFLAASDVKNGVWVYQGSGQPLTRAPEWQPIQGTRVRIAIGSNAGATFEVYQSSTLPIVVGTTSVWMIRLWDAVLSVVRFRVDDTLAINTTYIPYQDGTLHPVTDANVVGIPAVAQLPRADRDGTNLALTNQLALHCSGWRNSVAGVNVTVGLAQIDNNGGAGVGGGISWQVYANFLVGTLSLAQANPVMFLNNNGLNGDTLVVPTFRTANVIPTGHAALVTAALLLQRQIQ